MQPRGDIAAIADLAVHERHVVLWIEWRHEGEALQRPDRRGDRKFADALDELLARLAIGNEIGDRYAMQLVLLREIRDLRAAHHRAVVIDQFANDADRLEPRELAEIDRGFGMAGAHQHPALSRDQRKDMPGPDEIVGAGIAIGETPHRRGAIFCRNPGGGAMRVIDADRERGVMR